MDDRLKELAKGNIDKARTEHEPKERFPIEIGITPDRMSVLLLSKYGEIVESRDIDFRMDECTTSKIDKVVKWIYQSRKRGLLLCGTLGNGKTTMLRTLKAAFGSKAVYREAQDVYNEYRITKHLPQISEKDIVLIDDLGVEPSQFNDYGELHYPLAELLMRCYRFRLVTVIATNMTFEQLGETYGARLQDRMREMFAVINYTEPSYRK